MKTKSIFVLTAMVAMAFFGCKESPYINAPGDNSKNTDTLPSVVLPAAEDLEGFAIPEGCLTVYEAVDSCKNLADGANTQEKYYVKGWVRAFDSKHESGIQTYGNGTFFIAATNDGRSDSKMFEAYQVYGKDGKKLVSTDQVAIGDFVIIYGQLANFKGTAETVGKGAAYIYDSSNPNFDPKEDPSKITPDPEGVEIPEGCLNVYEARHICDSIGKGNQTNEEYYVKGWIRKLDSANDIAKYHNATFFIAATNDGSTDLFTFEAYRVKGLNKANLTNANQVEIGDFVILRCKLKNYNGTLETGDGAYIYYSTNPNLQ